MNKISKIKVICWIVLLCCVIVFFKATATAKTNDFNVPMSRENNNGTCEFVFYWGHNSLYTSMHQDTGTFYYDWDENDWERAYRKAVNNRDKFDVNSIDYYNKQIEVFRVLAGWNYYVWNLEGCGINSNNSTHIDYTCIDGSNMELLYDPAWSMSYYLAKYNYLKAYKNAEDSLYDYYIATSSNDQALIDLQNKYNEINEQEINKLEKVWQYSIINVH